MDTVTVVDDTAGVNDWSEITSRYDSTGRLWLQTIDYDDGRVLTTYQLNRGDDTVATGYAQNMLEYTKTTDVYGQVVFAEHDPTGTESWHDIYDYYNARGLETVQRIEYRDGTTGLTIFDTDNSQAYAYRTETHDAQGRTTDDTFFMDDGTVMRFVYDVTNTQKYIYTVSHYDATGLRTSVDTYNDDGTCSVTTGGDAFGGGSSTSTYDAAGRLILQVGVGAYGEAYGLGRYDTDNSHPWTTIAEDYYDNGRISDSRTVFDDGHVESYTFPYGHNTTADFYDQSGALVEQTYSSGTVDLYDPHNQYDWTLIRYYDAGDVGNPEYKYSEKEIDYDDGRREFDSFSANGYGTVSGYKSGASFLQDIVTDTYEQKQTTFADGTHETDTDFQSGPIAHVGTVSDPFGRVTRNVVDYADGHYTSQYNRYAIDMSDAWTVLVDTYADQYAYQNDIVSSYTKQYYDHTSSYVQFDPYDVQDWSSITSRYDDRGSLTDVATVFDDGTSKHVFYDVDNTSDVASITHTYDAGHRLTGQVTVFDDGHVM